MSEVWPMHSCLWTARPITDRPPRILALPLSQSRAPRATRSAGAFVPLPTRPVNGREGSQPEDGLLRTDQAHPPQTMGPVAQPRDLRLGADAL